MSPVTHRESASGGTSGAMDTSASGPTPSQHGLVRLVGRVTWLRRHRTRSLVLIVALIVAALLIDLAIPSYPIAGFYLLPIMVAALALSERQAVVVSVICLVLAVYVLVLQHRTDGPTIIVVCFSALGAAGLIALAYLFRQVDELYQAERSTTARLQFLTAQTLALQEISVLDFDRPLSDLLHNILGQAQQLLGGDAACIYRFDPHLDVLTPVAAIGLSSAMGGDIALSAEQNPVGQAVSGRRPIAVTDTEDLPASAAGSSARRDSAHAIDHESAYRSLLAVPLVVRRALYGALALYYRRPRAFTDEDVNLAASFTGQAALAIENARLRDGVERTAAAAERSRLARDLHDSVTQSLFAASLKAEALRRRWEPASAEAEHNLEDVERLTRGALAEMRSLLMEMRPSTLAEASLRDLLRHLVEAAEGRSLVTVKLTVRGRCQLPPDVTVSLYRIAQEAMNNVVRHSKAKWARVQLRQSAARVKLIIGDDGRGFDTSQVAPGHLGLKMMQERAESVGASLIVESEPRRGTVVTAEWADGGDGPQQKEEE
jgi:signal transduction histidine kinase